MQGIFMDEHLCLDAKESEKVRMNRMLMLYR